MGPEASISCHRDENEFPRLPPAVDVVSLSFFFGKGVVLPHEGACRGPCLMLNVPCRTGSQHTLVEAGGRP